MAFDLGPIKDPEALQGIEHDLTQTTPGEVLSATAGDAFDSLPTVRGMGATARSFADGLPISQGEGSFVSADSMGLPPAPQITPEEATAKAKAAGVQGLTFDKPMAADSAQSIIDDHVTKQQRDDVVARNGSAILSGVVPRFVIGSLLQMLDPVNALALMIPAAPEAFVAERLAAAAGVFERTAIRAGAGAVNGAVGMAALVPLDIAMSKSDYNDWSAGDALRNIFMGAALGAGGHMLLGGLFGKEHLNPAEANTSMEATRAAIGQAADGRPVDVAAVPHVAEITRAADDLQAHSAPFSGGIDAFHGTPHEFSRFDTGAIGGGEGNQSFGHGLYFAEERKVADDYRRKLSGPDAKLDALQNQVNDAIAERNKVRASGADTTAINEKLQDLYRQEDAARNANNNGHLYQVKLNAKLEELLDLNKSLSAQPEVMAKLEAAGIDTNGGAMSGAELHDTLKSQFGFRSDAYGIDEEKGGAEAAQLLQQAGLKGIRYLDAGSRADGEGSRNIVIFDHKDVQITHKNGVPVAQAAADLRAQADAAAKGMAERAMNPPTDPVLDQAARVNKATIDSAPQITGEIDKDVAEFTKIVQEEHLRLQADFASGRIIETQEMRDMMLGADHTESIGKASAGYAACLAGKALI